MPDAIYADTLVSSSGRKGIDDAAAKRIGSVIASKYRIESLLGAGGMGAVFLVTHLGIERKFALKLLHADTSNGPESEARFAREAQAAGRIGHPNIVDVFDLGQAEDGAPYMVMELLPGESVAERVLRGPLPIDEAVEISLEVLHALEAAHAAGIIHRDIKPANIFLVKKSDGGRSIKVLDFGIAKFASEAGSGALTGTGAILGSPLYMAPEQVRADKDIDARADVWAVGATLYECLVGEPAHAAPSHSAVIARIVTVPVRSIRERRPDVDGHLDGIVLRALSIDVNARFPSAAEMHRALDAYASGSASTMASLPPLGMASSRSSSGSSVPQPTTKRPFPAFFTGLAVLAGIVLSVIGLGLWKGRTPAPEPLFPTVVDSELSNAQPAPPPPLPDPIVVPPPPVVAPALSASAPAASASVKRDPPHVTRPPVPSAVASVIAPTCKPGEQLSSGHCCRAGMVWQTDHCDRPLATSAPF
jgi:serine/threonine protein kinase